MIAPNFRNCTQCKLQAATHCTECARSMAARAAEVAVAEVSAKAAREVLFKEYEHVVGNVRKVADGLMERVGLLQNPVDIRDVVAHGVAASATNGHRLGLQEAAKAVCDGCARNMSYFRVGDSVYHDDREAIGRTVDPTRGFAPVTCKAEAIVRALVGHDYLEVPEVDNG